MHAPTAPAPQRVCPRCATVSHTPARRCPHCRASFRRYPLLALLAALTLFGAGILAGVYGMLMAFGDELDRELDRQVEVVQRDLDRDIGRLERQLDRRLPAP